MNLRIYRHLNFENECEVIIYSLIFKLKRTHYPITANNQRISLKGWWQFRLKLTFDEKVDFV